MADRIVAALQSKAEQEEIHNRLCVIEEKMGRIERLLYELNAKEHVAKLEPASKSLLATACSATTELVRTHSTLSAVKAALDDLPHKIDRMLSVFTDNVVSLMDQPVPVPPRAGHHQEKVFSLISFLLSFF